MPYISRSNGAQQEGLHRMYTAGELFGWDDTKYPVLVVDWKDKELHAKTRKEKLIHKLDNLANIMSKFDSNYFDSISKINLFRFYSLNFNIIETSFTTYLIDIINFNYELIFI